MTTRLLLVRHGESQVQLDRVVGGEAGCRGLSDLGRRQVQALADRWAAIGLTADVLLASTLPRAVETAEGLAHALGDLPVKTDPDLVEMVPGECDGITWEEYDRRYGLDLAAHPYTAVSPGGESLAQFYLRVGSTLHRLAREHAGDTVVVACHGGIIDGSVNCFLGLPTQRARSFGINSTNTGVTEWLVTGDVDDVLHWHLARYNDAAHLEQLT